MQHKKIENYLNCLRCIYLLKTVGDEWPLGDLAELLDQYHKDLFTEKREVIVVA